MADSKIHVYFMPGMAANPSIFKHIHLPEEVFEQHLLEWFVPRKHMTLKEYAMAMNEKIKHLNVVLIGVSFGGLLVQEMAHLKPFKKVIIVSSVKSENELPKRMLFARRTNIHKLLPTGLVNNLEFLIKYGLGEKVNKRLELYQEYLSVRDKYYMDWSIDQIVKWKKQKDVPGLVHIHGDKDVVFPLEKINDCITVKNGTHTMIIHRAKWFNENLPTIILQ